MSDLGFSHNSRMKRVVVSMLAKCGQLLPCSAPSPHLPALLVCAQNEYAALFVALIGEGSSPQVRGLRVHVFGSGAHLPTWAH